MLNNYFEADTEIKLTSGPRSIKLNKCDFMLKLNKKIAE